MGLYEDIYYRLPEDARFLEFGFVNGSPGYLCKGPCSGRNVSIMGCDNDPGNEHACIQDLLLIGDQKVGRISDCTIICNMVKRECA